MSSNSNQAIEIYKSKEGDISFNVSVFDDTVWLTQNQMGELFGRKQHTISEHITNIFKEGEFDKSSVHRKFRYTALMERSITPFTII
jgi:hypothetical protein